MTGDASAPARETDGEPADIGSDIGDYDDLLATLDVLEQEALRKVEAGRVYDPQNERVRIKWIRIAKEIVSEKRKVKSERDLEELSERLAHIEEQRSI